MEEEDRLTERWHFSASGGGRSTGFSVIDVRASCRVWTGVSGTSRVNMKLCESFFLSDWNVSESLLRVSLQTDGLKILH